MRSATEKTPFKMFKPSLKRSLTGVSVQLGDSLGLHLKTRKNLIEEIHSGLSVEVIERLSQALDITERDLAQYATIPLRTLSRRKKEGRFHPDESDRLARIALLFDDAVTLFEGDRAKASQWFRTPKKALSGASPLEYVDTEPGAQEVRDFIGRIQHGVFS